MALSVASLCLILLGTLYLANASPTWGGFNYNPPSSYWPTARPTSSASTESSTTSSTSSPEPASTTSTPEESKYEELLRTAKYLYDELKKVKFDGQPAQNCTCNEETTVPAINGNNNLNFVGGGNNMRITGK